MDRRTFIKTSAFAGAVAFIGNNRDLYSKNDLNMSVGGFTKELQSLSYEDTAQAALEIGWDGIECPVRPGGHVLPERVEEDLPKMVEALKKRNLDLHAMATNIHNPGEEYTERVLRAGSKLGIKYYRLGWWNYDLSKPINMQLEEIKPQLKDLAALNEEFGIIGVYQNHSGRDSVGAPVWDIYELMNDIDSDYIGVHFDIGHATVEGGYSWLLNFHRIKSKVKAVIVKDFNWIKNIKGEWEAEWCPLGSGKIDPEFFNVLLETNFEGPITMHHEYEVGGKGDNRLYNIMKAMKADTITLKEWLNK